LSAAIGVCKPAIWLVFTVWVSSEDSLVHLVPILSQLHAQRWVIGDLWLGLCLLIQDFWWAKMSLSVVRKGVPGQWWFSTWTKTSIKNHSGDIITHRSFPIKLRSPQRTRFLYHIFVHAKRRDGTHERIMAMEGNFWNAWCITKESKETSIWIYPRFFSSWQGGWGCSAKVSSDKYSVALGRTALIL
jgi:hypothetical protein